MRTLNVTKPLYLLLASMVFFSCKEEKVVKEQKPVNVKVLTVGTETDYSPIMYSGTIKADKSVTLSFQVSGTVQNVMVDKGDFVSKGSLVATMDAVIYQNKYAAQKAQADLAKENYDRILAVYKKGSIAEIKMLDAKSKYEQAQAAANATYEQMQYTKLKAPMEGYISNRFLDPGDLGSPGVPVVVIEQIEKVKAELPVPDNEINKTQKGDTVIIQIPALGNTKFTGTISDVAIVSERGTPVYTAGVTINNPDHKIKPGMVCNAYFKSLTSGNDIVVPIQAIVVDEEDNKFVYTVTDNKAYRKKVETGALYDNGIAITKGIKKGDKIVVSGYHKLTDSTQVNIIQ